MAITADPYADYQTLGRNIVIGRSWLDRNLQNIEKISLRDGNFEHPDLLGAAYKYPVKHLADSGKEAGEFYAPA